MHVIGGRDQKICPWILPQAFEQGVALEPDNEALVAALLEMKKMKLTDGQRWCTVYSQS